MSDRELLRKCREALQAVIKDDPSVIVVMVYGALVDKIDAALAAPDGWVRVPISTLDRIMRDCEHGSRIWKECDALLREFRLQAAAKGES